MKHTARILEDGDGQVILLPEACRISAAEVWVTLDESTGIITLIPKFSDSPAMSSAEKKSDSAGSTNKTA